MATMKRTPSGSWCILLYLGRDHKGKNKYKRLTAPTKKELQKIVDEVKAEYNADTIDLRDMTVSEAIGKYIERKRKSASPKTIREYLQYQRVMFPGLQRRKIRDLTDYICQSAIDAEGEELAPKTVKNRWGLLKAACSFYVKDFDPRVELPKVKRHRFEMPEEQPLLDFLKAIEGEGIEIPVLLAITCGMRRGEISALDLKKDVDYTKGIIHVSKDMVMNEHGQWVVKPPKTEAGDRLIPCPKPVIEKLKQARDNPRYKMLIPNSITKDYSIKSKPFGINCTFHGLRHYYASVMAALNVPENYQMERMGHTTNSMLKRYQEYLNSKEAEIDVNMEQHFNDFFDKLSAEN